MKSRTWERVKEVFAEAAGLPAAEREGFVRKTCGDDEPVCREVLDLLAEIDQMTESFLAHPVADRALSLLEQDRRRSVAGRRIGHWRLIEEIGSGGMGVVYLAEREEGGFRQKGALKMVPGVRGRELMRRLEGERQMLAGLTHPGIARLLDGGATEEGSPYLVMEYVEGETITDYCTRQRLSIEERIELVLAIGSAVQSAHQKLIVHRDLKPSNILVDADGRPKLLDFGIAKLLDPSDAGDASTRLRALTPEYASPEQLAEGPVSTASDVFSLGVLLYELLTDQRPFGPLRISLPELARRMEAGPAPPSSIVTRAGTAEGLDPEEVARRRRTTPAALRRRLRGDLDAIVLRALRAEPGNRYPTVEALTRELCRERDGEPVAARGGALSYRALRFLRRHRAALSVAAAASALLLAATLVSLSQARTARLERDRSERVVTALKRILWSPNPDWYADGGSTDITMAAVLQSASEWLPEALADLPEEEASVRYSLGTTFAALGELEASERELRRARELHRQVWGEHHVETAKATAALGGILERRGRHAEAATEFRRVLETCERADCDAFLDYLVPGTYWALGLSLKATGAEAAAEQALGKVLELRQRQGHGEDALSANAMIALGFLHRDRGERAVAERFYRRALAFATGLERAGALLALGELHKLEGRLEEARQELDEAHDAALGLVGPRHYTLGILETQRAHLALLEGDVAQARAEIQAALDLLGGALEQQSREVGRALAVRGEILIAAGEIEAGQEVLETALGTLAASLPADAWELAEVQSLLGACRSSRGLRDEGERLLAGAVERLTARLGEDDPRTQRAQRRAAEVRGPAPAGMARRSNVSEPAAGGTKLDREPR